MRIKIFQSIVDTIRLKKLKFALTYNPLLLEIVLNIYHLLGFNKTKLLRYLGCNCPDNVNIDSNFHTINPAGLTIGKHSSLGDYTQIYCNGNVKIGKYVIFSKNCCLMAGTHHVDDYSDRVDDQDICIEDGCWIGISVTILGGVTIGKGSIIGAGSLVNKDIPPYSIAVGNPCKVIKKREPAQIIKQPTTYDISELDKD